MTLASGFWWPADKDLACIMLIIVCIGWPVGSLSSGIDMLPSTLRAQIEGSSWSCGDNISFLSFSVFPSFSSSNCLFRTLTNCPSNLTLISFQFGEVIAFLSIGTADKSSWMEPKDYHNSQSHHHKSIFIKSPHYFCPLLNEAISSCRDKYSGTNNKKWDFYYQIIIINQSDIKRGWLVRNRHSL